MNIESQQPSHPHFQLMTTLKFPKSLQLGLQPPVLNTVQSGENSFFCGYSNGMVFEYSYDEMAKDLEKNPLAVPQHKDIFYPYQNCDIIDMDIFSKDILLTCTHTEVTLLNLVKNKRICLRGHEQTLIAISSHPISPLVVSVSNLVIQHDLRVQKPIFVNYITPPVYDIKFFPDGQFYLLSGQPIRIGKDKWMRTLENGISTLSKNSKFVLSNDMNGKVTLWDWRKSQKVREISGVKNEENYQSIHMLMNSHVNSEFLFLEDDGNIMHHDFIKNQTSRQKLFQPGSQDTWKSQISAQNERTKHFLAYEHTKTEVKCYNIK